ncbi:MAG: protein-disulfide reductase DsbD domain-containing protein [Pseudomonadota bacterium]
MPCRLLRNVAVRVAVWALLALMCAPAGAQAAALGLGRRCQCAGSADLGDRGDRHRPAARSRARVRGVRLISATEATGTAQRLDLGLEFRLAPGWHIYWRAPGDTGYPPSVEWAGSDNLAAASLAWPAPRRYNLLGIDAIGYQGTVVLPLLATLDRPGAPLRLNAALEYLACSDICVTLPGRAGARPAARHRRAPAPRPRWWRRPPAGVPTDPSSAGLTVLAARLAGSADQPRLALDLAATPPLDDPDVFVERLGRGFAGKPRLSPLGDGGVRLELPLYNVTRAEAARLAAVDGVALTLVDGSRAVELTAHPAVGVEADFPFWLEMIGIALLGGLILNLMPCVLPVLALKLAMVGGYGGAARRQIRVGFLATALGILVSFLAACRRRAAGRARPAARSAGASSSSSPGFWWR